METSNFKKILYAAITALFLLSIWQASAYIFGLNTSLIPTPTKVSKAIIEWAKSGDLLKDFCVSIWRALTGLIVGSVIGILLGLFTGRNQKANLILSPFLNMLKAFPPVALLPVFITFFGIGDFSKIFSISFATMFPLWVNTHFGASTIPVEFVRSAKLLSKSKSKQFFKVILPASLNSIISGFRIGIAMSFIMLYVSELAGASSGLGYEISSSHLAYRMDKMFGALIVLGLIASLIDFTFNKTIKFFFPWVQLTKVM